MHRENTISEHLRDLLDVYTEVNISGIGLFSVVSKAAWIDTSNNELYPPTKTLSIRPESTDAIELVNVVAEQMQDDMAGLKSLGDRLNTYVAELNQTGTTRINGIGAISRDTDYGLTLVDVHTQWSEGTAYLPVLEMFPISHSLESFKPTAQSAILDKSDPKDLIKPDTYQEIGKQSLLPLIVLGLGVILFLWFFKGCDPSQLGGDTTIEAPEKSIELPRDTPHNLNSKYVDYLTPEVLEQGCKIVVGSYSKKINAESQLKEFSAAGYMVEMSQNGNAYRVAIVFNCIDYNLKEYLERVKEEIAPNAWYLSPSIKTEEL